MYLFSDETYNGVEDAFHICDSQNEVDISWCEGPCGRSSSVMDLFHADRSPDQECNCCRSKELIRKDVAFICSVFSSDGSISYGQRVTNRKVPVAQDQCMCNLCEERKSIQGHHLQSLNT